MSKDASKASTNYDKTLRRPWDEVYLPRATSHTRPIAHDHFTSSTLNGGKGRAGPSSLHTTLEGPTEYVNAR